VSRGTEAEPTRERVRATIGLVGGYWRPLAAVARLLEELGELAELSAFHPNHEPGPAGDTVRLASELADLWIITTALSDQFLGVVTEPGSHSPSGAELVSGEPSLIARDPLGSLLAAAGRIARIVNHYDGPKAPRAFDGWISLSDAVADFHRALDETALALDIDLAGAVAAKLDAIPALDSGRFASDAHDPSTAASVRRFRSLQPAGELDDAESCGDFENDNTRLWGSPEWSSDDFSSCLDSIAADLAAFTKAAVWERLDGYVVCGPQLGSPELFEDWLARILTELASRDPATGHRAGSATRQPPSSGTWQQASGPRKGPERYFSFNGLDLLASGFCSLCEMGEFHGEPVATLLVLSVEDPSEAHRAQ
jgi:hypothetical protein